MPLLAAGLALAPAVALAQPAPPPATSSPDAVGPKALQDFSLSGTVTRPADQQPVQQPKPMRQPRAEAQPPLQQVTVRPVTRTATTAPGLKRTETAAAEPSIQPQPRPQPDPPTPAASLPVTTGVAGPAIAARTPAAAPNFAPDPQPASALAGAHSSPMLIWLFEALVLALAGAFLFWRTRGRELFAGSARFDLFTAPESEPPPAPPPTPAPAPRAQPRPVPQPSAAPAPKPAAPASTGVVSTRLRPWIDIGFQPVRCVLEDQRVLVEFDLELFNSGSAPARAVLAEARLFNAGAEQDSLIAEFFANPVALGERIAVIPPLKRMSVRTQAFAPREQIQAYELAGRQVFVPLIAFNVLYSWSGGEGQTSVSHLLGRDTKGDKLGPFHLDLGPHIFRNLAARLLPAGVRR